MPEGWELILVLLVIVLVFGAKRLPDSARALGRSMRILKAETKGLHDDDSSSTTTTARVVTPVAPAAPVQAQPVQTQPVQTQPVPPVEPVVVQPVQAQAYNGQQLFDAQGRPVHVTPPVQQASPQA